MQNKSSIDKQNKVADFIHAHRHTPITKAVPNEKLKKRLERIEQKLMSALGELQSLKRDI